MDNVFFNKQAIFLIDVTKENLTNIVDFFENCKNIHIIINNLNTQTLNNIQNLINIIPADKKIIFCSLSRLTHKIVDNIKKENKQKIIYISKEKKLTLSKNNGRFITFEDTLNGVLVKDILNDKVLYEQLFIRDKFI